MLIIGDIDCIPNNYKNNFIIYNLLANTGVYPVVDILPNTREFNYHNEKEFDMQYMSFIFNNDYYFYEFFSKIIYPLYLGYNVYLIVDRNDIFDTIAESITKLIQQRYGYNSAIINEPEDIDYVNKDESFNICGLPNLDIDKERYSYIYAKLNMKLTPDNNVYIQKEDIPC